MSAATTGSTAGPWCPPTRFKWLRSLTFPPLRNTYVRINWKDSNDHAARARPFGARSGITERVGDDVSWRLSVRARAIRKLGRAVAPTGARSARPWPARPTDSSRTDGPTERPDPLSAAARRAPALLSPRRLMARLNFRKVRPRPFYFNPIWRPTSWTRACDSASSASRCF